MAQNSAQAQVLYVHNNNVLLLNLVSGAVKQLTNFSVSTSTGYVNYQQISTSTVVVTFNNDVYTIDLLSQKMNFVNNSELKLVNSIVAGDGLNSYLDGIDFISPTEFSFLISNGSKLDKNGEPSEDLYLYNNQSAKLVGEFVAPFGEGASVSHSPNGRYLSYAGNEEAAIYDIKTGILSQPPGQRGDATVWANNNVMFSATMRDQETIWSYYDVSTNKSVNLPFILSSAVTPYAGNSVVYETGNQSNQTTTQIWEYNFSTGSRKELLDNAAILSPTADGNQILYAKVVPCDGKENSYFASQCSALSQIQIWGGVKSKSLGLLNLNNDSTSSVANLSQIQDFLNSLQVTLY
ncbi:MAG: hypothetical protein KGL39_23380 [Patescibacteria group bacterium]|nr:hypothetical protein [Patescibacteria group bacterium]